jgi:transcriptional regulator with XRE-family HTH domain
VNKLKKLRLLSGLTQERLSEMLQISQPYLSMLERNKCEITPNLNRKINEIFGVSVKFID